MLQYHMSHLDSAHLFPCRPVWFEVSAPVRLLVLRICWCIQHAHILTFSKAAPVEHTEKR